MSDDAVELTDLEVIQRWSVAVRSASAEREEVVAALRADLAWLEGRRQRPRATGHDEDDGPRRAPRRPTTSARSASATPARRTPAKSSGSRAAKSATKRSSSSRGGTRRR